MNGTHSQTWGRAVAIGLTLVSLGAGPLAGQEKGDERPPAAVKAEMKRVGEPQAEGRSLVLAVRLKRSGEAEVESATELPGVAVLPDAAIGGFLWEVSANGETVAVQTFTDPFEGHSYGGTPPEHHFIRLEESTVVVKIPGWSLEAPLERLDLRFFQILPGETPVERMDAATLGGLRRSDRLKTLAEIPGGRLAAEARQKGRRAEE